ncbi:MarR family transcriptional regulator [bacterium]|nr:MarR family transcriptional regulator [bacterium]
MNFPQLKLENQLCFPLYAVSKEITRRYAPFLEPLELTYTQYIVMLVLWEEKKCNVTELGKKLFLDSGTLTPLLKKLEAKGYVKRSREESDERCLSVSLTAKGKELQGKAADIPKNMASCVNLSQSEVKTLYRALYKILDSFKADLHPL